MSISLHVFAVPYYKTILNTKSFILTALRTLVQDMKPGRGPALARLTMAVERFEVVVWVAHAGVDRALPWR